MKSTHSIAALVIASTAFLTSCANTSTAPSSSASSGPTTNVASGYGTIDSIQVVPADSGTSGTGAVVGGLVGGLIGNQIGSGTGRTVATVAGVAGGALVGNKVEANRKANAGDKFQINVRMDNGGQQSVIQDSANGLSVGQHIRIVDGRVYPR